MTNKNPRNVCFSFLSKSRENHFFFRIANMTSNAKTPKDAGNQSVCVNVNAELSNYPVCCYSNQGVHVRGGHIDFHFIQFYSTLKMLTDADTRRKQYTTFSTYSSACLMWPTILRKMVLRTSATENREHNWQKPQSPTLKPIQPSHREPQKCQTHV